MSSATSARHLVSTIAPREPQRALELARAIQDPWYRCQALAAAALHHKDSTTRGRAIDEALAAASELEEPNRVVTASAWPVKVLALKGCLDRVSAEVDRLLGVIRKEESPVRRADALRYLFGAVIHADPRVIIKVIEALANASLQPLQSGRRNRKGESVLEDCLPAIARIDQRTAEELLARRACGSRTRTHAVGSNGGVGSPRAVAAHRRTVSEK